MSIASTPQSLINIPGAPPIPGLTFRRFRGKADYPVMVVILDACNDADGLEYISVGYRKTTGVRSCQIFEGAHFPYQPMKKVLEGAR